MKKRATGLLLALLMILSLIPGTAFAETANPTGELAVAGGEVKTGGSVTVRVDLTKNPGIAALRLTVTYPDGFTLTDVRQGAALSGEGMAFTKSGSIETGNSASFVWDSLTNSTDNGTLLELTFLVAEDAALGKQSITVTCGKNDALNENLKPVTLETRTGTVRVTCGHASSESIPAKAATCTKTGLTEGRKCARCGEILTAQQTIPALGHDFDTDAAGCRRCDVTVTKIEIPTQPATLIYALNKGELNVTGGKLKRTFSDDTADEIDMTAAMVSGFDNTKAGQQTLTVTCNGQTATFIVTVKETTGVTVSGTATSFGDADADVLIQLIESGASEPAYEKTVKGNTASYSIDGVLPGTYTVRVMKKNHVTREYTVTVGAENVQQDVKIHLLGDVTGDGVVNTMDVGRLYAHVRGTRVITDAYILACANVAGTDNVINTMDVGRLYAHVRGTNLLW